MMERLAIRAEQALLGSVHLDPAGQQHVLGWVEPGDMFRPWHGQVLSAMLRARAHGVLPGAAEVRAELGRDPDLPASVARDGVLLADLMEAAPRAGHAEAYAVLVAEGGIRRRLELAGSRLAQAAESADLDAALPQLVRARREVAACRVRWLALPAALRAVAPGVPRALEPARGTGRLGAVREGTRRPGGRARLAADGRDAAPADAASGLPAGGEPGPGGDAEAAGLAALRDLIAGPSQIARVRGWLRPGHFASPAHGEVYALAVEMDSAGKPVDPVTVSWEAARRGLSADPGFLTGGAGAFAVASARRVHRLGWCAQAARAGRELQAGAEDISRPPRRLLDSAGERLRALAESARPEPAPSRALRSAGPPGRCLGAGRPRQAGNEAVR